MSEEHAQGDGDDSNFPSGSRLLGRFTRSISRTSDSLPFGHASGARPVLVKSALNSHDGATTL